VGRMHGRGGEEGRLGFFTPSAAAAGGCRMDR
jgi:hypothetical protein